MFIVTAKLNKKKILAAVILALAVLCAAVILIRTVSGGSGSSGESGIHATVKSNSDRVAYLARFGWQVNEEPLETLEITIPREFPDVYEQYNKIQLEQGFDLGDYRGMKATRYTYRVLNYPSGGDDVVADLIVCGHSVIAGNIQSTAIDGFMHGLKWPENDSKDG